MGMLSKAFSLLIYAIRPQYWWGSTDSFEQVPKPNLRHRLSPKQIQACKHRPAAFRYRGRAR